MCFIEFLNEYNGAFTVLLTLVLVIINIYMGWQNYVLREDATKPKVLANICVKNGNICYKFTNFGAYPATNIQIKIDPYLIEQKQNGDPLRQKLERLETGSFFLASGKELIISTETMWNKIKDHKLSLSYTYKDLSGKSYSQKYLFDLSVLDLDLAFKYPDK
ncbi:MAG TPA: hypothetical protein H9975_09290 [Candidatus Alistipes avistercoris]|uniref:hypothetical protein n=1 Tax=Alistipes communis TaxID=2585118 RepID=UPI001FA24E7E|nr:hypothetical protein [Alistipes communis]HIX97655.1 hypothetical protein [Candidatus Alistipes avistercoris]